MKVNKVYRPKGVSANVTDNDGRHFVWKRQRQRQTQYPLFEFPLHYRTNTSHGESVCQKFRENWRREDGVQCPDNIQEMFLSRQFEAKVRQSQPSKVRY